MQFSTKNVILLISLVFFASNSKANSIFGAGLPGRNLELGLEDGATFNNYFLSGNPVQQPEGKNPYGFMIGEAGPQQPSIDQNYHLMQGANGQVRVMPAQMFQWKMYQGR